MKFMIGLAVLAFVAVAICVSAIRIENARNDDSCARQQTGQKVSEQIVARLRDNLWIRSSDAFIPIDELEAELGLMQDVDGRKSVLVDCSERFITMDVDLETRVRAKNNSDNYICFAKRLFKLMAYNEVDNAVCMDFFMRALEKHKSVCLSGIPREAEMDYRTWAAWNEVLDWLQVNLKSDLVHLYGELRKSRFMGQRKDLEAELFRRFNDFYVPATNEISRQIAFRRRHPRRPPPIELNSSQ